MKNLSAVLIASVAVLVTGSAAFGQQGSDCNCNNGGGSYIGYQSSDWGQCNTCQTGRGRNARCNDRGRMTPLAHPDSGWAPPTHYPVNYDGAWYAAYHPQAYYGNPGGGFVANYPTVYQPNDTTQLGYSYMKVPTWQSNTGVIPGVPRPGNFHSRGCNNCNSCQTCAHGVYGTPDGRVVQPAQAKSSFLTRMRLTSLTDLFD